jgi:hypothetical protein
MADYQTGPAHPDQVRVRLDRIYLEFGHRYARRVVPVLADAVALDHLLVDYSAPAPLANAVVLLLLVSVILDY